MSCDIKQAMFNYLEYFRNQGLAQVIWNKNVLQAHTKLVGGLIRLNAAGALHEDIIAHVLSGVPILSESKFYKMFDTMLQNAKFGNYSLLHGITHCSSTLEIIEAIFDQATNY
jgi:hypothetical protein